MSRREEWLELVSKSKGGTSYIVKEAGDELLKERTYVGAGAKSNIQRENLKIPQ